MGNLRDEKISSWMADNWDDLREQYRLHLRLITETSDGFNYLIVPCYTEFCFDEYIRLEKEKNDE